MIKRIFAGLIAFFCLISITGCSIVPSNMESLIKPPSLNQDQENIYAALQASLKEQTSIQLNYPKSGDYRSAIITTSIDETHGQQALAFYQSSLQSTLNEAQLRVCLLDKIDDKWQVVWDLPGKGSDVDKVLFYRDEESGQTFVVIGYSLSGQTQNEFCIYRYKDGIFEQVYSDDYQMLEMYDLNSDGKDELVIISYSDDAKDKETVNDDTPLSTTAQLIQYKGGQFITIDKTPTMGKATSYIHIIKDTQTFGKPALFLDEQISKTTYATEILTVENNHLTNLTFGSNASLFNQTMRTQVPISYDINRDNIIEIPKTEYFPGYSADSEEPMYQTNWYRLNGKSFEPVCSSFINYTQGYGFLLPDSWKGKVSVSHVVENDEILFFVYKGTVKDTSSPLLSIKTQTLNSIRQNGIPEGYFKIKTIGQVVYLAKQYPAENKAYALTNQEVCDRFVEMHLS